jgi:CBS domain-containing protein
MSTGVVTVSPDATVEDAMRTLLDRGVDAAPVVDTTGQLVGMLASGDLIVQESRLHFPTVVSLLGATLTLPGAQKHFEDDLRRALGAAVHEVMSTDPAVCHEDDTIESAATAMHEHDVSRLPVVRDGAVVGVISRTDILRSILSER